MRWKADPKPKHGDAKQVVKFAFFPVRVNNQMVWLERYIVVYEYNDADSVLPFWQEVTKSSSHF